MKLSGRKFEQLFYHEQILLGTFAASTIFKVLLLTITDSANVSTLRNAQITQTKWNRQSFLLLSISPVICGCCHHHFCLITKHLTQAKGIHTEDTAK